MKKTRYAKFYFLKEKKPQTKYFIKQQTIDNSISKSRLSKSLMGNKLNFKLIDIKGNATPKLMNKAINKVSLSFQKKKYKNILTQEKKPTKLKYLNDDILDKIFLKKEENNHIIEHTINANNKNNINLNDNDKNLTFLRSKTIQQRVSKISEKNNLNEKNKYDYFTGLLNNSLVDIKNVNIKKYSHVARLALHVNDKLDVIEEHVKIIKPQNKFAKFKLLLKNQKDKNINLLKELYESRVQNENILKDYIKRLKN